MLWKRVLALHVEAGDSQRNQAPPPEKLLEVARGVNRLIPALRPDRLLPPLCMG